ncbi:acyltransferase family protein [Sporosarcina sp. E16_8]|uniref:acyltransferase family protein n=1 Tax=Sporosarcina sp. E16_8 TaxID=2789295 RepID=UPI001A93799D|nr:acyltransferase family protein [Sporosarcina sp. E16_8]MBO0589492.1 acyltransferase [Sporosarcina sp. E16_8]
MTDLRKPEKRYRPEIKGIRTIATLLIAVYHIWFGRVSGGVDVFFILSGFLMTTSLLSRMERMGTIKLGEYFLGLSRRLFTQALLVIVVVGGFSLLFLPQIQWGEIITHMTASIFYYENWRLAFDAVDYLAQDNSASPFQHYWSLGVQGQLYSSWPILIITVYFLAQKVFKTPERKTFLVALIIICAASISYSVYQTNVNQPWAYFDTFARVWEFGIAASSTILISLYIDDVKADMLVPVYDEKDYPGARAIFDKTEAPKGFEPIPSPLAINQDLPAFYGQMECLGKGQIHVKKCSFNESDNPDYTIALVGGSHSGHWFPALEILAKEMNFQLDLYNHDGCRFTNEDTENHLTKTCLKWNANLLKHLQENPPDLVFTTSTLNKHDTVPVGYIGQWRQLEGITTVFAVRDNPRMKKDIPSCLENADNPLECAITRDEGVSKVLPWENTEGIPSNVIFADLTDYFCDDQICYPVIGNVIVYRDNNHLTAQYAKTLAPFLKKPLQEALESLDVMSEKDSF